MTPLKDTLSPAPETPLSPAPGGRRAALAMLALLPLLLTAALTSYFYYQSRYDEGIGHYAFPWTAKWISTPYPESNYATFRKTIYVDGDVRSAYIAIAVNNYCTLYVNGLPTGGLQQIGRESAPYTAIGAPRHTIYGHLIDIGYRLHPGPNVIAILADTDESHAPLIAVQGSVETTRRQTFVSDATWKCARSQEKQDAQPWFSTHFMDADWAQATVSPEPVTALVDTIPGPLETPFRGAYIASRQAGTGTVTFRRDFDAPGATTQGWMRIISPSPYDMTLNGQTLASTSLADGFNKKLVVGFVGMDGLARMNANPNPNNSPMTAVGKGADAFLLKGLLRRGTNELLITVHPQDLEHLKHPATLYVDSEFNFADGTRRTLRTDDTWQTTAEGGWAMARVASQPTALAQKLIPIGTLTALVPKAGGYSRLVRNTLIFLVSFAGLAWLSVRAVLRRRTGWNLETLQQMGVTFLAPAFVLTGAALVQIVFMKSVGNVLFASAQFAGATLAAAGIAWAGSVLVLLARGPRLAGAGAAGGSIDWGTANRGTNAGWGGSVIPPSAKDAASGFGGWFNRYGYAALVAVMMVAAALIAGHNLGADPFHVDEYVSLLATRGILHRGIPIYEGSGIVYPRSSLYHYLLAPFLAYGLHTGHLWVTRYLSVFWEVCLIPVAYLFAREAKGRVAGLAAAGAIAFSPYMLVFAREARFYEQFAFFVTLTAYFLFRSIHHPEQGKYRSLSLLAFTAGYLSQQISVTLLPAFALVIILAGQGREWVKPRTLFWAAVAGVVIFVDLFVYFKYCVTPLPFLDNAANPLLALHTYNLELTPKQILSSSEHTQIAFGLFYLAGLVYILLRAFRMPRPEEEAADGAKMVMPWWSFLYLMTGVSMLVSTVLIPRSTERYILHLNPLFLITAVCMATALGQAVRRWVGETWHSSAAARTTVWLYGLTLALVIGAGFHPLRAWNTGDRMVHHDVGSVAHYVNEYKKPGDKIMVYSTETTLVENSQADYFYRPSGESLDKYISRDGKMRERNSGAIVLDSVDKLKDVMTHHNRVWLVMSPGNALFKGGPSLPMREIVLKNFDLKYESLNAQVWLWDRGNNRFHDIGGGVGDIQRTY